jgi:hypothetical protein
MTDLTTFYGINGHPIQAAMTEIAAIGVVATVATDLWQRLLQAIAGLPLANWGLVGRWVAWFSRGMFVHRPITATPRAVSLHARRTARRSDERKPQGLQRRRVSVKGLRKVRSLANMLRHLGHFP